MGDWLRGTWVGKGIIGWLLFIFIPVVFSILRIFGAVDFFIKRYQGNTMTDLIASPYFIPVLMVFGLFLIIHTGLKVRNGSPSKTTKTDRPAERLIPKLESARQYRPIRRHNLGSNGFTFK